MISFYDFFNAPLSLSTNAEDELATDVYSTSVKLASHLFEVLSRPKLTVLASRINFNSVIKTLVLIEDTVLTAVGDLLSKNILCTLCTPQCTFFACKEKRASKFQKRLADIGFDLCVFVTKTRQIFGEKLLAGLPWQQDERDFAPHLLAINKTIDSQITKFDSFFAEVNSKMAAASKAAGMRKDSSKTGGNPKYLRVSSKQLDGDKNQSSILPVNDKRLERSDDLSNKGDDEKPENLSKEEPPQYHQPNERQDTQDSIKFLVTLDQLSVHKSDDGGGHLSNEFDIVEVYQKFSNDKGNDNIEHFGTNTVDYEDEEVAIPFHAKETLRKQEVDLIKTELASYKATLAATKVDKAFKHYLGSLQYIRLSNSHFPMVDEPLTVIQNRYYFTLPHIVNYCSKEKQTETIQNLIKYPPRTRKEIFLREMNLYIGDLVEYQKLYAFKELSWIVWIANVTKYVNAAIIVFINIYALVGLNVDNRRTFAQGSFIYTVLIIGALISGMCSIFMPVQKMFLAKTFLTKFNSYKNKISQDFEHERSKSVIQEDRRTFIRIYDKYARLVSKVNTLLQLSKSKYLIALAHYDNLFQFTIFYLSVTGVVNKTIQQSFINFFLVLIETSTIYRLYSNLAVDFRKIVVYILFVFLLFYQIGVVYYASFLESDQVTEGINCSNMLMCIETIISFSLIGDHGYTEGHKEAFKEDERQRWRLFSDSLSIGVIFFFTVVMVIGKD